MQPRTGFRTALIATITLLASAAAHPAVAQQSGSSRLPSRNTLAKYGLERAWWNQATLNPRRDKLQYIVADEQLLYAQATSGVLSAFDAETGKRLWSRQIGRLDQPGYPVFSNRDLVLAAYGTQVYALNRFNGDILWHVKLPGQPSASPAVDDQRLYVGTLDGTVYAFDLRKIRDLFEKALLPQWSYQTIAWRYRTAGEITTPPISTGSSVNFASRDGSLYSVTAEERELQFQVETDAPVSAPLAESETALFLASEDFNFYCINKVGGQVRWDFTAGLPVRQQPRIIGENIYLTPFTGGMHCLTTTTGEPVWWRPEVTTFLAANRRLLFASDELGTVQILSRATGVPLGGLALREFSVRFQNDRTDRLYLGTPTGLIVCIRDQNLSFPIYHMHPERRPILPEFAPEGGEPPADGEATEESP